MMAGRKDIFSFCVLLLSELSENEGKILVTLYMAAVFASSPA